MRISELVERSGVPLASVKYYLREGLLMPGKATSATQATYSGEHVDRLKLITALTHVVGLPIQNVKVILHLIDHPDDGSLFDTLGRAIAALGPDSSNEHPDVGGPDYPLAREAITKLGQLYDPRFAAVAQLERALQAADAAGLPLSDDQLAVYAEHMRAIAEADLERMPRSGRQESVEYAVLGTALYEPVLMALRRLAHQDIAATMLPR